MKKLNFLAAFFLAVAMLTTTFTSCNKDDDEGSSDPKDLVGTWKLVSVEEWWKDLEDGESDHDKYTIDSDDDDEMVILTFNEDGTCTSKEYDDKKGKIVTETVSYTASNGVIKFSSGVEYGECNFSVSGSTLTFSKELTEDDEWMKAVWVFKKQ